MSRGPEDNKKHLLDLIRDFDTAMLVTRSPGGELGGRPLSVAKADDDGRLFFAIRIESPAVTELDDDQRVAVLFQDEQRFVSLSGVARVRTERAVARRLWTDAWRLWFPRGVDDPTLAILEVLPSGGEYWDRTGLAGMRYLFAAMKAYATGTKPPEGADDRQNAKVPL
jgi:general stress protein 26